MSDPYYMGPEKQAPQSRPEPLVEQLNRLLDGFLANCDGATAALVVSDDGFPVARRFRTEMEPRRLAAITSSLLGAQRGSEVKNSVKEVQMTTDGTYHFMTLVPDKPDALVVLITTRKANLGMGWVSVRKAVNQIAPLCP